MNAFILRKRVLQSIPRSFAASSFRPPHFSKTCIMCSFSTSSSVLIRWVGAASICFGRHSPRFLIAHFSSTILSHSAKIVLPPSGFPYGMIELLPSSKRRHCWFCNCESASRFMAKVVRFRKVSVSHDSAYRASAVVRQSYNHSLISDHTSSLVMMVSGVWSRSTPRTRQ